MPLFFLVERERFLHDALPREAGADVLGGEPLEHPDGVGVAEGVGELLGQIVHVAFAEGDAVVVDDVGAFLDVGGDDAVAVAHGFQQAEGHPLEVAGQDKEAGVAVELFPQLTVYKAGEDDPFVAADPALSARPCTTGYRRNRLR